MTPAAFWWPATAGGAGFVAGVLANVAIRRLPSSGSRPGVCSACRAPSGPLDAVGVLAWLSRGGQCRWCRRRLSLIPPAVELIGAGLWVLMALRRPPSIDAVAFMIFVTALLALIVIDFQHYLLPDAITLPGIVLGLGATWLKDWPVTLVDAALSAGVGYFAMMLLAKAAEWYYREEALGQGDWKMVAMLGAFLGSTKVLATVFLANCAGAVVGLLLVAALGDRRRQKLPLGSFLGAAGILIAFW